MPYNLPISCKYAVYPYGSLAVEKQRIYTLQCPFFVLWARDFQVFFTAHLRIVVTFCFAYGRLFIVDCGWIDMRPVLFSVVKDATAARIGRNEKAALLGAAFA
jgi:hypothetical protein